MSWKKRNAAGARRARWGSEYFRVPAGYSLLVAAPKVSRWVRGYPPEGGGLSPGRGAPLSVDPANRAPAEQRLTIRLTKAQLEQLKARATASRLSVAEYARLVLLEEEGRALVSLNDFERKAFEKAAARSGYSLAYFLRGLLLHDPALRTRKRRR